MILWHFIDKTIHQKLSCFMDNKNNHRSSGYKESLFYVVTSEKKIKSWEPTLWSSFVFPWASCCMSVPVYYWLSSIRRLQSVIYPLSATDWPFMAHSYGNSSQTSNSPHNNRCTDCVQWSSASPLWIQTTSVCGWWAILKSPVRYIYSDVTPWGYRGNPYDDSQWFKMFPLTDGS